MQDLKMQNVELIKLQGDNKGESRALWEEIFSEDTERFLDYYYQYKAPEAWVYLLKEHGQVISMLHLNPYPVYCNGVVRQSYYIVAVATKAEYRHKGCMRRLLQEALHDAKEWGCPFLFLMPANPAIYEPFDFSYVYAHQSYVPADECVTEGIRRCVRTGAQTGLVWQNQCYRLQPYQVADAAEIQALEAFARQALEARYRTFCIHDSAYFTRLQKELQSEKGSVVLVYTEHDGRKSLAGYVCYASEGAEAYQEVVLTGAAAQLFVPHEKKDAIMALSLNGETFVTPCYFPEIV